MIKKIKKFINLVLKKEHKIAKIRYTIEYNKNKSIKNVAIFESYHGSNISSNEFYLLKELYSREDNEIKIYVVSNKNKKEVIRKRLDYYGLINVDIVIMHSDEYCELLCISRFLINSTSFPDYFIKKNGQTYLNTWHGTPLKNMGRSDIDSPHMITNIQRNFLMSDYILFPNKHTEEIITRDYMLPGLYKGHYIREGYPRNDVFYLENNNIRNELNLNDKKIIVYMPTWRGKLGRHSSMHEISNVYLFIDKLSSQLSDNEVLYVSLHYLMAKGVNLNDFHNVKSIPNHIETYDFLSISDVLITDYSSVMFDFFNSGKRIALYQFDLQEYNEYRGLSIDNDRLPFFKSNNSDEIINYALSDMSLDIISDSNDILGWENADSSKKLVDFLFYGIKGSLDLHKAIDTEKEKVLIFAGSLAKNGITVSLLNLIKSIDKNIFDITLTFSQVVVSKNKNIINDIPRNISYIPFRGMLNFTYFEAFVLFLFHAFEFKFPFIESKINKIYKRDFKRIYCDCDFDHLIHFSGYDRHIINLFGSTDIQKTIYCHSDMWKEYKVRGFCHKPTMDIAYSKYNNIALVTKALSDGLNGYNVNKNNICVVENIHPHDEVIKKSELDVEFNEETESTIQLKELNDLLSNDEYLKFITIGRFSIEKGHDRLISAFERVHAENNKCFLIIIGGPGKEYRNTLTQAKSSCAAKKIIIIHSIRNPFPILKSCDLFVFPSHYEGLGLVMLEAISLKVPVISTDMPAPKAFLEQGYGQIVENSEQGIYQGMCDFLEGLVRSSEVDWDKYNRNALSQFYSLLVKS